MKKLCTVLLLMVMLAGCGQAPVTDLNGPKSVLDPTSDADVLNIYYSNLLLAQKGGTENDCSAVFPVERLILKTDDHPTAILKKLFLGPTPEEETVYGYSSLFGYETRDAVKSVMVKDGTAYVNLTDIRMTITSASASCASAAFVASITKTLEQFPEITRVLFAIEGDPTPFYEFMQVGCNAENDNCDKTPYQNF